MTDFENDLINEFKIPIRDKNQKIWLLRTESGRFYRDFTQNNYVALGWDRVPFSVIGDKNTTEKEKKEKISLCYPEESRPGLILGQLNTFYERMKVGDLVLIPSESSKELYMGTLGNIITEVEHKESDDEYEKCRYSHKRTVEWIKAISPQIDVYLSRAIKSHQAVTEVTEYADILYRNIFPYYIEDSSIHLTFHKTTDSNFSLYDSIKLETAVMDIFQAVSKMYKLPDNKNSFKIKTAVGSPGFIEIIAENFNGGTIVALLIILLVFGTSISRDKDGKISFSIGISNIIESINRLINDRKNRQLTDAEIKKANAEADKIINETKIAKAESKANIKKIEAEAKETEAAANKIQSESNKNNAEALKTLSTINATDLQAVSSSIIQPLESLQQISENNSIGVNP